MVATNMTIRDIMVQEWKTLFHYKSPIVLLLIAIPIVYTALFGLAYSSNVIKYIPAVIYDQDQTPASRALTQAFVDSEKYNIIAQVSTQEEMEHYLRDNNALVAITIPPTFQQHIKLSLASEVLVTANGTNVTFANTVITSSQEIVQTFSAGTGKKLLEAANQLPAMALHTVVPVKLGIRIINNPITSYSNFMLAGLAINGLQIAILLTAGTTITKEYNQLSRWNNTSSLAIIIGKLIPYWLCSTAVFGSLVWLMNVFFDIPFRGFLSHLLILGSTFTFFVTAICLFFSAIAKNEVAALQNPLLYIMPGLLLSGLSWPLFAMNDISRAFSALMPLTYTADTLRDLMLIGYSPMLMTNTLIMLISGIIFGLVATLIFSLRRKKAQAPCQEVSL